MCKNNAADFTHAIESLPMDKFRTTVDIATLLENQSRRR
jgi:hypothetical protein